MFLPEKQNRGAFRPRAFAVQNTRGNFTELSWAVSDLFPLELEPYRAPYDESNRREVMGMEVGVVIWFQLKELGVLISQLRNMRPKLSFVHCRYLLVGRL